MRIRNLQGVVVVGALCCVLGTAACKSQDAAPSGPKLDERWKQLAGKEDGSMVIMDTESMINNGRPTIWFRRIDDTGKVKREWRLAFICEKREYVMLEKYVEGGEKGGLQKADVSGDSKSIKPESYQEEAFNLACKKK